MIPPSYSLSRYLKAKQTVDERALNRRVADRYIEELDRLAGESNGALSIVDLGAGRGPTAQRVVQALREGAAQSIRYNLIDQSPQLLGEAATKLRKWGTDQGFDVQEDSDQLRCSRGRQSILFRFYPMDATQYLSESADGSISSVIAQSFIDLVNVPRTLSLISRKMREGGVLYFPLTFDGRTRFLPERPEFPSQQITTYYHESMTRQTDEGPTGGAHTGRQLLKWLPKIGTLLDVGSSDWLVHPQGAIGYAGDEAYFLHHILHFVEHELASDARVSSATVSNWIDDRRQCVEGEHLIYHAGQLDVLARAHGGN